MIELVIIVAIYILSVLMGAYGVIYCATNNLVFGGILCIIFIACACVRIDELFDIVYDVGYFDDEEDDDDDGEW